MRVHRDKETWREQARATGICSQGMLDTFFEQYPSERFLYLNVPVNLSMSDITGQQLIR